LKRPARPQGLSQSELAGKAGISRHAVSCWECSPTVDPRGWAVQRMATGEPRTGAILQGLRTNSRGRGTGLSPDQVLPDYSPLSTRGRDVSIPPSALDSLRKASITPLYLSRMQEKEAQRQTRRRVFWAVKTIRKGTPCRNKSESGCKRCKFHGDKSNEPRTKEGRERVVLRPRRSGI
jgi:hypothetical protein